MTKRGRKSIQELLTATAPEGIDRVSRPTAPHDLTDEEVVTWAAVVEALPADYFTADNLPLLSQYCRHVVQARRIAEMMERATSDPSLKVRDWDRLLRMQARESAIILACATKLRIAHQSTRSTRGNPLNRTPPSAPWEC